MVFLTTMMMIGQSGASDNSAAVETSYFHLCDKNHGHATNNVIDLKIPEEVCNNLKAQQGYEMNDICCRICKCTMSTFGIVMMSFLIAYSLFAVAMFILCMLQKI